MISLPTPKAPYCLDEFASKQPTAKFGDDSFTACKAETRTILWENQRHQCGFCERPIQNIGFKKGMPDDSIRLAHLKHSQIALTVFL